MTSIRGAEKVSRTSGAETSFEVPIRPSGANASPPIGQRSPVLSPATGPSG